MSPKVVWTTPADLTREIRRLWERGRILAAQITGEPVFPLRLPLRRPDAKAMAERFDEVRAWIRALDEGSRDRRGFGYAIEWHQYPMPHSVCAEEIADMALWLGRVLGA